MRWKLTFVLLLLNAAAFYYIYHLERQEDPREQLQRDSQLVLPRAGDIVGITMESLADGRKRTLEKTRPGWQLTEPVRWPANENAVQKILTQLEYLEREVRIPLSDIEKSGQTLKDFGLAPARFRLTLDSLGGEQTFLDIGAPTQMGQRLYVMAEGSGEVLVVNDGLLAAIAAPLSDLRSQRVFDIPVFELESLTIQTSGQRIRLAKGKDGWSFETPVPAKADDQLVQNALALVVGQRAVQLLAPGSVTPELTGLATPALRMTLGGNNRRQTLLIGASVAELSKGAPAQLYARLESGDDDGTIFTVLAAPFEWLTRAQEELRERRVLRFDPAKVTALEIQRGGKNLTLQKLESRGPDEPAAWQSVSTMANGEVKTESAATPRVTALVTALNQLEAVAFVSDAPAPSDLQAWGLDDPVASVTVRAARDWTLILGNNAGTTDEETAEPWANPRNLYARTAGHPSVFAVDLSILGDLRVDPLAYRDRVLTSLPRGARVRAIKITDLEDDKVLFEQHIDPQSETWASALADDDPDRNTVLALVDTLKEFRVKEYLLPRFEALPNLPWRYRLEAEVDMPGGGGQPETRSYSFAVRDGLKQVGGAPRENVTFLLTKPTIDALFPLSFARNPPAAPLSPEEVEQADVDAGGPRHVAPVPETAPAKP